LNSSGIEQPKQSQADLAREQNRLWKSRKAKYAFQLSHSHDDYEL
jgi:hypothetical protein